MSQEQRAASEIYVFDEFSPFGTGEEARLKSECPADKKVKVEDLFKFSRTRGDYEVSIAAAFIAIFFLVFFWTETGWHNRKLPEDIWGYLGHQIGLLELEGRVTRLGRILKQSWVAPAICLLVLVPAAILNLRGSRRETLWRKRFLLPTSPYFELTKYVAALEYVAYFIVYTLLVPLLGYLISTLLLGTFLTRRLGYRTPVWLLRGFTTSFIIVIAFRTLLQIKTPVSIWLYDQLPDAMRVFMLTYF